MKIGDVIKEYRTTHGISQREMAQLLRFSHSYISILERGTNPTTNAEAVPSIEFVARLASLLNMDIDKLMKMVDGNQPILIPPQNKYSDERRELLHLIEALPDDKLPEAINYLTYLSQTTSRAAKGA